jgi:ketosteroid isomerase-like protein
MSEKDSPAALGQAIARYNEAWNAHDLDAIMSMHAPDMVFHNHTAGESAEGEAAREHIGSIFGTWPDIESRRAGSTSATASSSRSGPRPQRIRT